MIEVGWHLGRGKGCATEAARACLDYGFPSLHLDRIVAVVHPDNPASRRVTERLGMKPEGRIRVYNFDLDLFALNAPAA
ncbi:MAG: GNAT family N-acetyltransferase [Thermoflexales bacterium]